MLQLQVTAAAFRPAPRDCARDRPGLLDLLRERLDGLVNRGDLGPSDFKVTSVGAGRRPTPTEVVVVTEPRPTR